MSSIDPTTQNPTPVKTVAYGKLADLQQSTLICEYTTGSEPELLMASAGVDITSEYSDPSLSSSWAQVEYKDTDGAYLEKKFYNQDGSGYEVRLTDIPSNYPVSGTFLVPANTKIELWCRIINGLSITRAFGAIMKIC